MTAKNQNDTNLPPLGKRMTWVDDASSVTRLIRGLMFLCAVLVVFDLIIHRHSYSALESLFGFYALAGFIAFTCIVLGSKALRTIIGRDEAYYAPKAVDAEQYPEQGLQVLNHADTQAAANEPGDHPFNGDER